MSFCSVRRWRNSNPGGELKKILQRLSSEGHSAISLNAKATIRLCSKHILLYEHLKILI